MPKFNPSRILRTGEDPIELGVGYANEPAIRMRFTANGGSMTIKEWDFEAEDWILPDGPENNIGTDQAIVIDRNHGWPMLIEVQGENAVLSVIGNIRS